MKKPRFAILDMLRGLAVFVMLQAHSVYFFHDRTSPFLLSLEKIGNTVAFTTFLLISGATTFIAYLDDEKLKKEKIQKLKGRLKILIAAYFTLAFVIAAPNIMSAQGFKKLEVIFDILTFRFLPSYTEFIPPIIILPILVVGFWKYFEKIVKSVPIMFVFGVSVYLLGQLIYDIPTHSWLVPWKALIAGSQGYYRFPLLSYFPVFILGLSWGWWLTKIKTIKEQKNLSESLAIFFLSGIFFILAGNLSLNLSPKELFLRWPPSLGFLFLGCLFAFASAYLLYRVLHLSRLRLTRDFLLVLGQNALGIWWAHILILKIYEMGDGQKMGSLVLFYLLFMGVIVVSLAIASFIPFNYKFRLTFQRDMFHEHLMEKTPTEDFKEEVIYEVEKDIRKVEKYFFLIPRKGKPSLIKKRHFLGAFLGLSLASFMIFPTTMEEIKMQLKESKNVYWWDDHFAYKKQLEIKNLQSLNDLATNKTVKFELNHKKLVEEKKSDISGSDVLLMYWNGKNYEKTIFWTENSWNQNNTLISFNLKEKVGPGDSYKNYYLYYGNPLSEEPHATVQKNEDPNLKYQITALEEQSYPVLLEINRKWFIKTNNRKFDDQIKIGLVGPTDLTEAKSEYKISGKNVTGELEMTSDGIWEAVIPKDRLSPGKHEVQATISSKEGTIHSQKSGFIISEPLYTTWTIDWEGKDVSDIYLSAISEIAKNYNITLTHMFNPRIYIADNISKSRQDYLTRWIKSRAEKYGEEIGLHLHMYYDFVAAAGVEPKKEPNWGDDGDGYGSLTTNYTSEEMVKILNQALTLFEEKGLGRPVTYRAGGWFANSQTLSAVESVGIKADSSGRSYYKFFSQVGPWNLATDAQPYRPSDKDANSRGDMSIWEIPNNGADSYWFSGEEMIERFDSIYRGGVLVDKKQVTFLSHPDWFSKKEQEKVTKVFDHTDAYSYNKDQGPVIYTTLSDILNSWSK